MIVQGPNRLARRHLWLGLAAIALAGLTIPVLRAGVEPEPDAVTQPDPPPLVVDSELGWASMPTIYSIDFADDRHGFALWGRCPTGGDLRCERRLMSTKDGRVWSEQQFDSAELASPSRLAGQVVALGDDRVLLTDLEGGERFFSDDAGRTWRAVPARPDGTVAEIPADGLLETQCVEPRADQVCPRRLVVTLPDTGHRAWLANWPDLDRLSTELRPATDGTWAATGRDPATGLWTAAISRDHGRTWSAAALPAPPDVPIDRLAIVGSGQHRYALASARIAEGFEPRALVAIFHSTDGGLTWTLTRVTGREPPRSVGGSAIVTPDGALFIAVDDVVGPGYLSVDGGRSFKAVGEPDITDIRRTRAGYLAVPIDRPAGHYRASSDGVIWTDVKLP
jgi:hypothetical protein